MKKITYLTVLLLTFLMVSGCGQNIPSESTEKAATSSVLDQSPSNSADNHGEDALQQVIITIGEEKFPTVFYANESAEVLIDQMPMTLRMEDYHGQEKVVRLPEKLPAVETERPATIRAGELYLWSGNSLVFFYTSFSNSYGGYVPLGYVEDPSGLAEAMGSGSVAVNFSTK